MTAPAGDAAPEAQQLCCYRHPDRPTGVRCSRCDRPICPSCMVPASVGFHCPECLSEGRRTTRQARTVYGGRIRPGAQPGLITRILIGINVVVFVITAASGASVVSGGTGTSTIYDRFALVPVQVAHGQYYRLITAAFLHYGILHIAFNMYALYVMGPPLEAALGRLRYVTLYVLSGIGGGLLTTAFAPLGEQAAGASGAIFGLFGAFYIVARHRNLQTGSIVATIAINLVFSFTFSNIDWRGHVGGLITGAAIGVVLAYAPNGPRRDQLQAAGVALIAIVMAGLGVLAVHHVRNECPVLQSQQGELFCPPAGYSPYPVSPGT